MNRSLYVRSYSPSSWVFYISPSLLPMVIELDISEGGTTLDKPLLLSFFK